MKPLADRMRPTSLANYVGQSHLVGKGAVLRKAIEGGRIPSMILWGPPGVGKTTLGEFDFPFIGSAIFHIERCEFGRERCAGNDRKGQKPTFF